MFKPGDVLSVTWYGRPIKVIQTDSIETFYDAEFEYIGWGLRRARTAIFLRTRTKHLQQTGSALRSEPLSPKEFDRFRPDLPMRLFQHHEADWSDDPATLLALETNYTLPFGQVAIIPFGPQGAAMRPQIVGREGGCLSLASLIRAARRAQVARCGEVIGVGVYRSGIVGGTPSYYLWGAVDRAGHAG